MTTVQTPTILVVDDEEGIRELIEMILSEEGYKIVLAENGIQAEAMLEKAEPHLIVLDMNMPGKGGVEFYRDTVADYDGGHPKYPVLVITGRDDGQDYFKGLPVDGFLPKPFDVEIFIKEVARILGSRSGSGESLNLIE